MRTESTQLSESIESFQNLLVSHATGGAGDPRVYRELRSHFITHHMLKDVVPRFVRTCRSIDEFWQFIKYEYATYQERRNFIWSEFRPLFDRVEGAQAVPSDAAVSQKLESFGLDTVHRLWTRAIERRQSDLEGAITLARTLLESTCKHILDTQNITYDPSSDLPQLDKATATSLNLAPSQQIESVFKQILGGCTAVVEGLGSLRNKVSDAHGQGKRPVRPAERHAELAVNLAGAMAIFLIQTLEARPVAATPNALQILE